MLKLQLKVLSHGMKQGKFLDEFKVNDKVNGKCNYNTFVKSCRKHCRDIKYLNND